MSPGLSRFHGEKAKAWGFSTSTVLGRGDGLYVQAPPSNAPTAAATATEDHHRTIRSLTAIDASTYPTVSDRMTITSPKPTKSRTTLSRFEALTGMRIQAAANTNAAITEALRSGAAIPMFFTQCSMSFRESRCEAYQGGRPTVASSSAVRPIAAPGCMRSELHCARNVRVEAQSDPGAIPVH